MFNGERKIKPIVNSDKRKVIFKRDLEVDNNFYKVMQKL